MLPTRPFVVALFALLAGGEFTCLGDERHPAYRIDVVVSETGAEEKILASPTVVTADRREAAVAMEEETTVDIDGSIVTIRAGYNVHLTPYRLKDGGVKLDMDFEFTQAVNEMGVDGVVEKVGVRRIQQVPLGVPVEFPIPQNRQAVRHIRVKVTEVEHRLTEAVPPAPRAAKPRPPQPRTIR